MKFKVGDRARLIGTPNGHCPEAVPYIGKEVEITGTNPAPWCHREHYDTSIPDGDGGTIAVVAEALEPIIPLGSWDKITRMVGKDIRDPVPA